MRDTEAFQRLADVLQGLCPNIRVSEMSVAPDGRGHIEIMVDHGMDDWLRISGTGVDLSLAVNHALDKLQESMP